MIFYFIFSPNEQRAGGGGGGREGRCQTFFFFFSCSADHERDWPPCKVVFFRLATNALNVINNNEDIYIMGPLRSRFNVVTSFRSRFNVVTSFTFQCSDFVLVSM